MASEVVAALITAIIAPIATVAIDRFIKVKPYKTERLNGLVGTWRGHLHQDEPDLKIDVLMILKAGRREVTGTASFTHPPTGKHITLQVRGGLKESSFLQLDYRNHKETVRQFGTAILELDDHAESLQGHYVGYGSINRAIVKGRILASKDA